MLHLNVIYICFFDLYTFCLFTYKYDLQEILKDLIFMKNGYLTIEEVFHLKQKVKLALKKGVFLCVIIV